MKKTWQVKDAKDRLSERARPSLKSLLLGPEPRGGLDIPPRGQRQRRTPKPIG